jgi:tripartite-type tricarboxylate transporter receptor subunit TctC
VINIFARGGTTMRRGLHLQAMVAGAVALAAFVPFGAKPTRADGVEDFYRGRTVSIIIGYSVGGGYDTYARLLSRFIGNHIPGKPNVVAQNMPGAGSIKAANYIAQVAPKDGTQFATFGRAVPVAPLLNISGATFDGTKLTWLGSISRDTSLCITSSRSAVKTWDDFLSKPSTVGGEGAGSDPDIFTLLYKNIFGAKAKLVTGYPGTSDIALAMERGELDGTCGMSWSTLRSRHPDWLKEKSINIIMQAGMKKEPELANVPFVLDLTQDQEKLQILKVILVSQEMARPFAAPPGIPADRKAALIKAFADTMKDPEFVAETKKQVLDVDPVSAKDVDAMLGEVYATPKDVVAKAEKATTE